MSLAALEIEPLSESLPPRVEELIQEAETRVEIYQQTAGKSLVVGFVPSDFRCVHATLAALRQSHLLTGHTFCEWGSGMGGVTCLAALLDFDACGIEIEPVLVEHARRLAEDFDIEVEFAEGSFIPPRGRDTVERYGALIWLEADGHNAYDDLGLEAEDFDVIFAYPWPGEEDVIYDLFDHVAAPGAILATYHGIDQMRLHRKVTNRSRKR
jgi:hypothetical protein